VIAAALLLALGVTALAGAANARRPRRSLLLLLPSWLWAMLVVELAAQLAVLDAAAAAALVAAGALDHTPGRVGLALLAVGVAATLPHLWAGLRTTVSADGRPEELDLDSDAPRFPWWHVLVPLLLPWRRGVAHDRGVVYAEVDGRRLRLDVYRPKRADGPRPAVLWIHGGGWFFGSRREQGLPLLNHLAANGWVGFNVDYRLSPQATLPEHVEDVKRAIAWIRAHADELGVDPSFVAITGGSAGGHLTALAALTAGDFQPGFEAEDCSVQAAVPFYGVYDLLDPAERHLPGLRQIVEWIVMKARADREPERFRAVSPTHRVHAGAPPFFVVHGDADTLVPVAESREFVERLRSVSAAPVLYAEMKGGQHAFDVIPTVRTVRVLRAVERFLALTYAGARENELEQELTAA
jgi:acetyl esterase/lipase